MKHLRLFIFVFLSVIFSNKSFSDIIDKITISGNTRITDETIITFLPVKLKDDIDEYQINNITKELYETNFFKNITITFNNNELNIKIEENPLIQNITFNGIKSNTLKQFITSETILKPRSSFTDFFLEQDLNKIKDNLNKRGYYFSSIKTKIETLDDNIINLIYDFNLGQKAKIKKISFIGNKIYKDNKLKSLILS